MSYMYLQGWKSSNDEKYLMTQMSRFWENVFGIGVFRSKRLNIYTILCFSQIELHLYNDLNVYFLYMPLFIFYYIV